MLAIEKLTAGYGGSAVLHGVNLVVADGDVLGVVGYNGMGKTSLLRAIMGVLPVYSGSLRWDGEDVKGVPVHQRNKQGMALVAQGCTGFPKLTVMENLQLSSYADKPKRANQVDKVLAQIPRLVRLLDRPSSGLSGGERQLLSLARALVTSPKLLLIDEITDGVQPSVCDELSDLLVSIAQEDGLSMVLVDQDLSFVSAVVRRAVVMQKGKIVAERTPAELLGDTPFDVAELGLAL